MPQTDKTFKRLWHSLEYFKHLLSFDPLTGLFTWNADRKPDIKAGDQAGWQEAQGYICIMIDGATYKAHRLAWLFTYKRWPANDTDHINRKRFDNRIVNLREATRTLNVVNSKVRSDNALGVKGVSICRNKFKKYLVQVKHGDQLIKKTFHTQDEAAEFYLIASRKVFGEFAS